MVTMEKSLQVSFELGPDGLAHFRRLLDKHRHAAGELDEATVTSKSAALLLELAAGHPSSFVREQAAVLTTMLDMLRDEDFAMEPGLRGPVISAMSYFAEPEDLIPDDLPGLGHVDDAIMIALVADELEAEMSAYAEFRNYRDVELGRRGDEAKVDRASFLDAKRRQMFDRIWDRRARRKR
jgi:uncharacterized membrane protein YkvA (DUF1232 family)